METMASTTYYPAILLRKRWRESTPNEMVFSPNTVKCSRELISTFRRSRGGGHLPNRSGS